MYDQPGPARERPAPPVASLMATARSAGNLTGHGLLAFIWGAPGAADGDAHSHDGDNAG